MYRIDLGTAGSTYLVSPEHSFVEVTRQGEIEGLTFDKVNNKFFLLYNRGARIVLGMPKLTEEVR